MTTQEYNNNELRIAIRDEERVVKSSLADRQAGLREYLDMAINTPSSLAERVEWMLEGNYGKGQQLMCERATTRMNRPALFAQMVAVYEFRTTRDMARKAWSKLTKTQQNELNKKITGKIVVWDMQRGAL